MIRTEYVFSFSTDKIQLGAKANEWSSTWWDSIFNKVSSKITIESNNDGDVALVKEGHAVVGKEKELVHGAFIISGYFLSCF